MGDGHLNKCKDCTKKDVAERIALKMKDPDWVEAELERCRIKMARARAEGKELRNPENLRKAKRKWGFRNRHKTRAELRMRRAVKAGIVKKKPCQVCGSKNSEAHHEDYSKPLEVVWLCDKHHKKRHVEIRKLKRKAAA